jgi:hypothetical protein
MRWWVAKASKHRQRVRTMKARWIRRQQESEGLGALHIEAGQVMCPHRGPTDIEECFVCSAFRGLRPGLDERLLCRRDRTLGLAALRIMG